MASQRQGNLAGARLSVLAPTRPYCDKFTWVCGFPVGGGGGEDG